MIQGRILGHHTRGNDILWGKFKRKRESMEQHEIQDEWKKNSEAWELRFLYKWSCAVSFDSVYVSTPLRNPVALLYIPTSVSVTLLKEKHIDSGA